MVKLIFLLLCLGMALPLQAAEFVRMTGIDFVDADLNDGDSFKVNVAGRELHLRLYHVDCPETTYSSKVDIQRIREQQRHFGLENISAVVRFGELAAQRTKELLSRPFTIHTSYAKAPGRSATGRYYAFVTTHDGRDLGHILVAEGFARVHGKTRSAPDGTPSALVVAELNDLRISATLKRAGIWSETDPELLTRFRRLQREEDQEMRVLRQSVADETAVLDRATPLDLNSAQSKELQQIPRIGPVTAERIIAGRPYSRIRDLLRVPGIGEKTLKAITPYVFVEAE